MNSYSFRRDIAGVANPYPFVRTAARQRSFANRLRHLATVRVTNGLSLALSVVQIGYKH